MDTLLHETWSSGMVKYALCCCRERHIVTMELGHYADLGWGGSNNHREAYCETWRKPEHGGF